MQLSLPHWRHASTCAAPDAGEPAPIMSPADQHSCLPETVQRGCTAVLLPSIPHTLNGSSSNSKSLTPSLLTHDGCCCCHCCRPLLSPSLAVHLHGKPPAKHAVCAMAWWAALLTALRPLPSLPPPLCCGRPLLAAPRTGRRQGHPLCGPQVPLPAGAAAVPAAGVPAVRRRGLASAAAEATQAAGRKAALHQHQAATRVRRCGSA